MEINFFYEDVEDLQLDELKISKWIQESVLNEGKMTDTISFIYCSDDYLLEMNQKYLDHDYYTDVITFDYVEGSKVSGDIFISLDRIRENAVSFGVDLLSEASRIMIHGVLHLLGYKDKDTEAKEIMTGKENFYLDRL